MNEISIVLFTATKNNYGYKTMVNILRNTILFFAR